MKDHDRDTAGSVFLYLVGLALIGLSYPWDGILRQAFGVDGVLSIFIALTAYAGHKIVSHILSAIAAVLFAAAFWTLLHQ